MLKLLPAPKRDVDNLQRWLEGNSCLARSETAYLNETNDLLSVRGYSAEALPQLESWVESVMVYFYHRFRKVY